MHPRRPDHGLTSCALCGAAVDRVRAPIVRVERDELIALCSAACAARFDEGERPEVEERRESTRTSRVANFAARFPDAELPFSPLIAAGVAFLISPFSERMPAAAAAAALLIAVSAVDLLIRALSDRLPRPGLVLASFGVLLYALFAHAQLEVIGWKGLMGASIASLALSARLILWINARHPLDVGLEQLGGDERLSRSVERLRRAPRGRIADATRIARILVLVAVGLVAALAALAIVMHRSDPSAAIRTIAAIFLALPLLAPPSITERAILEGAIAALRRGIHFTSPLAFERLGQSSHAVFQLHGTLTERKPELVGVHALDGEDPRAMLKAAGIAQSATPTHPLAAATREACSKEKISLGAARRVRAIPGQGILAIDARGEEIIIGNRSLLLEEGVSIAVAESIAEAVEARGDTAIFVATGQRVRGVLAFHYELREGAQEAIAALAELDVDATIVSGDHRASAAELARQLGVRHLRAEIGGNARAAELRRIQESASPIVIVEHREASSSLIAASDGGALSILIGASVHDDEAAILLEGSSPMSAAEAWERARRVRRNGLRAGLLVALVGIPNLILAAFFDLPPFAAAIVALGVELVAHQTGSGDVIPAHSGDGSGTTRGRTS